MRHDDTVKTGMLKTREVYRLLGLSSSSFYEKLPAMRRLGFPGKHPVLGLYCREAVETWLRKTSGLAIVATEAALEF